MSGIQVRPCCCKMRLIACLCMEWGTMSIERFSLASQAGLPEPDPEGARGYQ